jgi:glycosyltransferase involved in cell wall biosynthesis
MRAMRVLHVSPYFAPAYRYGGPARSILGLCRGLLDQGVGVEVFTTTANGSEELPMEVVERGSFEGVPVRYFPRSFPRRQFAASSLRAALAEKLRGVDLVHLHGLWNLPVWTGARECMRAGLPYVVSPRGMLDQGSFSHHRWRKEICFRMWERSYLSQSAFLHATSRSEEESLDRLSLGPSIVRLPNGVDPGTGMTTSRRSSGDGVVLFLGRLHPTKRIDLLLAAMDRVRSIRPGARLVLAGPPDGLDLERLLRDASRKEAVQVLGEVTTEKWSLLSSADVLVLCSDSESFGMSVVEALAVGTPVVATRTCPWEELETERCGYFVEQTPAGIAEGILAVLSDPAGARAMGERGRKLVANRYHWTVIGREMARRYRGILGSNDD